MNDLGRRAGQHRGGTKLVVRVDDRWSTGRMEAFSDGVFAIAITLLVLELSVPESDFANLWQGIADQWPSYLAYVTSFLTIGGIWVAHHGIFRRLAYANRQLMIVNLLLLMSVSFLPFPTTLMAEAIHDTEAERAAVIFYGTTLLVISLLLSALWGAAVLDRDVLEAGVRNDEVTAITRATTPSVGLYVVTIALAIVAPQAAVAFVALPRARGGRRGSRPAAT